MCKLSKKSGLKRIDPCMRNLINFVKAMNWETLACCCGHGKYPMTIVVKSICGLGGFELLSKTHIQRSRKFYKMDKQNYYYIPEVVNK